MDTKREPLVHSSHQSPTYFSIQSQLTHRVTVETGFQLHVYKRRWFILLLYALVTGLQSLVYNTFQPISKTAMAAFDWTTTDISLIANWGAVGFFLFIFLSSWLIEIKGLRVACLVGLSCITLGCAIRCITPQPPWVRWTMHIGQLCNGLGGPITTAAPPVLSTLWFPPHQRTTATALATVFKFMALAVSFIVSPLAVPEIEYKNCTSDNQTSFPDDTIMTTRYVDNDAQINCTDGAYFPEPPITKLRTDIMHLMYYEAGVAGLLLLIMLLYFPQRPRLPPCVSATVKREGFLQGLKNLRKYRSFWLLSFLFLLSGGVSSAWVGTMSLNLKPTGISEKQAGWIGFYSFICLCVSLLVIARLGDIFPRYMKWFIAGLSLLITVCFVPVCLFCEKLIYLSLPVLYALVIVGVVAGGSTIPLFYELGCELTYPISEGTANGVLTIFNHIGIILSLSTLLIPQIGIAWLTWGVVVTFGITCPAVLLVKERHLRLEVDKYHPDDAPEIIDPSLS